MLEVYQHTHPVQHGCAQVHGTEVALRVTGFLGEKHEEFRLRVTRPLVFLRQAVTNRCPSTIVVPHARKDWPVTEIPEHLLKRSRERKAAGVDASPSEASASTPATTAVAPVAKVVAETPVKAAVSKPEPTYVKAARSRGRIPSWAMATLALMPIFLFMYVRGLQPQKAEASGPIALGIENYGACASCHGADGAGGAGRVLKDGESLKTFPHIEDMLNWVYAGTEAYEAAGVATYGDPNREGGAHAPRSYNGSAMPAQGAMAGGALTEYEILGLICHIRYDISGADETGDWAEEYEKWCSAESEIFLGLQDGSITFDSPELGVGTAPRLGTAADAVNMTEG